MPVQKKTFKPALDYPNGAMASLLVKVDRQKKLLNLIRSGLPGTLAKHVRACVVRDRKLLLYTESAAWASQLRFYSRVIQDITCLKQGEFIEVTQVRIIAPTGTTRQESQTHIIPSPENIEIIRNNIRNVPDRKLKESLFRLSETLEKRYKAKTLAKQNS